MNLSAAKAAVDAEILAFQAKVHGILHDAITHSHEPPPDHEHPPDNPCNCTTSGDWHDPMTWGGAVPGPLDSWTIPAGKMVTVRTDINVGNGTVLGHLTFADVPLNFTARSIMVHGLMDSTAPVRAAQLTITLTGEEDVPGMGRRFLGAMGGGKIRLVAETPEVSWTKLAGNATPGSNIILLSEPPGWKVGDAFILTSTDFDYRQTEKLTVTDIEGAAVTFTPPLAYYHHGSITHIDHDKEGVPHEIDESAEVGLLTRLIKVQGPESSEADKIGAHVMIHGDTSVAEFEGVEFYRCGQSGILGRYPFHWHNVNDGGSNSILRRCSVHHSYQRGITIHKTNNTTVSDCVIYDTLGHGFFFEDGKEEGNTLINNLVAGVHRGILDTQFGPKDHFNKPSNGQPAAYWISNPNNHFIGNVAAGQAPGGLGFWFDLHQKVRPNSISATADPNYLNDRPEGTGDDPSVVEWLAHPERHPYNPSAQPFGVFRGNRAHSSTIATNPGLLSKEDGQGLFAEAGGSPLLIKGFTAFKNQRGQVWTAGGHRLVGCMLVGELPLFNHSTMEDSLCVRLTDNPVTYENEDDTWWTPGFVVKRSVVEDKKTSAVDGYDALPFIHHCVIAGFHSLYTLRQGNVIAGSITDSIVPPVCLANLLHSAEVAAESPMCINDQNNQWKQGKGFFTFNPSFVKTNSKILNSGGYWIPGEPPE